MRDQVWNPNVPRDRVQGIAFARPNDRGSSFPPEIASMLGFIDILDPSDRSLDESIRILKSQPPPARRKGLYPNYMFCDCKPASSGPTPRLQDLTHVDQIRPYRHECLFDLIEPKANGVFQLGQCWKHFSVPCPLAQPEFTLEPRPDDDKEWKQWKNSAMFPPEPKAYKLRLFTCDHDLHVDAEGNIRPVRIDSETLENRKRVEQAWIDSRKMVNSARSAKRKRESHLHTPPATPSVTNTSASSSRPSSAQLLPPVRRAKVIVTTRPGPLVRVNARQSQGNAISRHEARDSPDPFGQTETSSSDAPAVTRFRNSVKRLQGEGGIISPMDALGIAQTFCDIAPDVMSNIDENARHSRNRKIYIDNLDKTLGMTRRKISNLTVELEAEKAKNRQNVKTLEEKLARANETVEKTCEQRVLMVKKEAKRYQDLRQSYQALEKEMDLLVQRSKENKEALNSAVKKLEQELKGHEFQSANRNSPGMVEDGLATIARAPAAMLILPHSDQNTESDPQSLPNDATSPQHDPVKAESRFATMQSELHELGNRAKELELQNEELVKASEKLGEVENEKKLLKANLIVIIKYSLGQNRQLAEELVQLKEKLGEVVEENEELKTASAESNTAREDTEQAKREAQNDSTRLNGVADSLRDEYKLLERTSSDLIRDLKTRLGSAAASVVEWEEKAGKAKDLELDIVQVREELDASIKEMSAVKKRDEEARARIEKLESHVSHLEGNLADKEETIAENSSTLSDNQKTIERLRDQLDGASEGAKATDKQVASLSNRVEQLEEEKARASADVEKARQSLETSRNECVEAKLKAQAALANEASMKIRVEERMTELCEKSALVGQLRKEKAELHSQLDDSISARRGLEDRYASLQADLDQADNNFRDSSERLETYRSVTAARIDQYNKAKGILETEIISISDAVHVISEWETRLTGLYQALEKSGFGSTSGNPTAKLLQVRDGLRKASEKFSNAHRIMNEVGNEFHKDTVEPAPASNGSGSGAIGNEPAKNRGDEI